MKLEIDDYCFACGKENPIGLKMEFEYGEGSVRVVFTPRKDHQGWQDVVHGGILFTLLDEAMARMIINGGNMVVSLSIEIRFLRPAKVNQEIIITGKLKKTEERRFYASSKITDSNGKTLASAKGTYVKVE
jgi:uncharacterized protein (TIGR00369 family)